MKVGPTIKAFEALVNSKSRVKLVPEVAEPSSAGVMAAAYGRCGLEASDCSSGAEKLFVLDEF